MDKDHWEVVDEVAGDLQAELLRGLLEAQGIPVWLSREGAGRVYSLGVGRLGDVQILVPSSSSQQAKDVLEAYYAGEFAGEDTGEDLGELEGGPDEEPDEF